MNCETVDFGTVLCGVVKLVIIEAFVKWLNKTKERWKEKKIRGDRTDKTDY